MRRCIACKLCKALVVTGRVNGKSAMEYQRQSDQEKSR
jgi:hypothetical protein